MPIDSQVEVKQVRLVKGTGAQIAAARQAEEILETDLVVQTDAPELVSANTAITGATKCKITYDSKGLVTAGADLAFGDITTALGYTPYNSNNPAGYITGITSSDVTTALGYTPYNSSNPNGYTANVGTVTSVNNVSPVNGNVTLSIPSEVTETTVSNWGFTKNTGTVTSVNNVSPVSGNVTLSIPTVNNSTITITQGGVTKGSFTLNQASGDTIEIDAASSNYVLTVPDYTQPTELAMSQLHTMTSNGWIFSSGSVRLNSNIGPQICTGAAYTGVPVESGQVVYITGAVAKFYPCKA